MARSTCVYVVLGADATPVAGFTVKHELVTWLKGRRSELVDFEIWRCGDGIRQREPRRLRAFEVIGEDVL